MRRLIVFLCGCLMVFHTRTAAQDTLSTKFPADFTGHWKGQLQWYPSGKPPQAVEMQLIIQPLDSPGCYQWKMVYGNDQKDVRPYTLKAVDSALGHWVVDENNGIVLDGYWRGKHFSSIFSVQGSVITEIMWLEHGALQIEFLTHAEQPVRESGGRNDSPVARSFPVRGYQRAVLYRQSN